MALFSDYVQFYSGTAWVPIHADMVGDMTCEYGISGAAPDQRIADTGVLTFTLYNGTGKYTPYHASALAGWKKGAPVSVYISGFNKFFGWIEDIKIDSGSYGRKFVTVTAVDWIDHAAEFPMPLPPVLLNVRANEVISNISTFLPKAVNGATLDVGETVFPTAYDTMDGNTKAYSEISKVVNSEMGHFYIRHKTPLPNYMVFENATRRNGNSVLTMIPVDDTLLGLLLKEDGDQLLLETGDGMLLDESEDAFFDNSMLGMEVTYGQDLFNRVKLSVYPKRTDTSAQVLFKLDSPMHLPPVGVAESFSVTYKDPTGGAGRVTGVNMIAPVANTDYKMWTNADGTGTDITANLVISVVYGIDGATYTVRNDHTTLSGYVTLLQARGYGVYSQNPLDVIAEDVASQAQNGEYEVTIEQKYAIETAKSLVASKSILDYSKTPNTTLQSVEFNANRTPMLKQAFLNLDIGDLIRVKETQSAVDGWYWIQNIHWTYKASGAVYFGYGLKEHLSLKAGSLKLAEFEPIELIIGTPASKSGINYRYLPRVSNLKYRTISLWAQDVSHPERVGGTGTFFGLNSREHGWHCQLQDWVYPSIFIYRDTGAAWITPSSVGARYAWHFYVFAHDFSRLNLIPWMWVDGVPWQLVTYISFTGTGPTKSEVGAQFLLGNRVWETSDFTNQFPGKIKDVRVYDRILNGNEVSEMYSAGAGADVVRNGLVFQGPCVMTKRQANYGGAYITSADTFLDNMYGSVGEPMQPSNIKVTVL